jgi:hypothetical protein
VQALGHRPVIDLTECLCRQELKKLEKKERRTAAKDAARKSTSEGKRGVISTDGNDQ